MASLLFRDAIDYTRVRIHGNPPFLEYAKNRG